LTILHFLHIHRVPPSTTVAHIRVFAASIENRYSFETRSFADRSQRAELNVELRIAGRNKI